VTPTGCGFEQQPARRCAAISFPSRKIGSPRARNRYDDAAMWPEPAGPPRSLRNPAPFQPDASTTALHAMAPGPIVADLEPVRGSGCSGATRVVDPPLRRVDREPLAENLSILDLEARTAAARLPWPRLGAARRALLVNVGGSRGNWLGGRSGRSRSSSAPVVERRRHGRSCRTRPPVEQGLDRVARRIRPSLVTPVRIRIKQPGCRPRLAVEHFFFPASAAILDRPPRLISTALAATISWLKRIGLAAETRPPLRRRDDPDPGTPGPAQHLGRRAVQVVRGVCVLDAMVSRPSVPRYASRRRCLLPAAQNGVFPW